MKPWTERVLLTVLTLCAVLSAFYLRASGDGRRMEIPVQRVFAVAGTPAPEAGEAYRARRGEQRGQEYAALAVLAEKDEAAAALLRELVDRAEKELAVEAALAAQGQDGAVCALRGDTAVLCVRGALDAGAAQALIALCARLTGVGEENVLILDACGYL